MGKMPAGLARMAYWPAEDDGCFWVVESKTAKGWRRFVHHDYHCMYCFRLQMVAEASVTPTSDGVRQLLSDAIRVVFFDAVGTLLHPDPSAIDVYSEVGRRFGCRLDTATIKDRFRTAFRRQEDYDRDHGYRTDNAREMQRWRAIVAEVLDDVTDSEACFQTLFDHFARPDAWRCAADTGPVLGALAEQGYRLGLASNYDKRLHSVADGLPSLQPLRPRVISAEVGFCKPAARFFQKVCESADAAPHQILVVGDDLANDYEGAIAAGLSAVLCDPSGAHRDAVIARIGQLGELLTLLAPLR
jgi:putative hydrolase of the HAD superfamily